MVSTALRVSPRADQARDHRAHCRALAGWIGWGVGGVALALLFTWKANLVPSIGSAGPMSLKTLLCLLMASGSLLLFLRRGGSRIAHRAGTLMAALIVVPGALLLVQLVRVGQFLDGDILYGRDALSGVVVQGRMAVPTSLIFISLGVALVGLHRGWRPLVVEAAAGSAAGLSMLAEIGHAYQAHELYAPLALRGIALSSALLLGLVALGVLIARPDVGLVSLYAGPGIAGVVARSLIAPVLIVPFVLGWLTLAGVRLDLYDRAMAAALMAVCTTAVFAAVVTGLARTLSRLETRLRDLQQEIVQAQRVDVASYMAGWIAHEFNNLLTVIQGNVELAIEMPEVAGPARGCLVDVREACEEGAALSRKLLRFSGHEVVSTAPLDLVQVLDEMKSELASIVGPRVRVELRTSCERALIRANRTRIGYILVQLTLNARDAMPDGGTLELDLSCDASRLRFIMRDTGHGMPVEVREKVFEPFITTKPRVRGTGLGIPTIYGIVKQLNGTIEIDSEVGAGTTVTIELPTVVG